MEEAELQIVFTLPTNLEEVRFILQNILTFLRSCTMYLKIKLSTLISSIHRCSSLPSDPQAESFPRFLSLSLVVYLGKKTKLDLGEISIQHVRARTKRSLFHHQTFPFFPLNSKSSALLTAH